MLSGLETLWFILGYYVAMEPAYLHLLTSILVTLVCGKSLLMQMVNFKVDLLFRTIFNLMS